MWVFFVQAKPNLSKDWGLENNTNFISIFCLIKRSAIIFFTCILPDYVGPTSPRNFEKISIFENMTAGFLLSCQNSLRLEISLLCH